MLAEEQSKHMGAALTFMERYRKEGDNFMDQILVVTGDKHGFQTSFLRVNINLWNGIILIYHQNP
jgi:hypothetical protein